MIGPRIHPGSGPDTTIPLRYLVTAAAAFLLATVGVAWLAPELGGHYYHPRIVALAHTVALGWITMTILGASFQLIPIVLERPIWSERLARWQFWLLLAAIIGMVGHFYIGTWPGLLWAAGLLAAGLAAHFVNLAVSLRGFDRWSFTARLIVLGYAGLALTLLFGLTLAADRVWKFLPGGFFPTLHAHVQLALLGWIAPMVLGVAARVYPMFLLAPEPAGWPARLQLWGLVAGIPALVVGLLAVPVLVPPGALAVSAAAAGHIYWVSQMAADRKRPTLDWGLRFLFTGTAFLLALVLVGLGLALDLLSGPRAALAYAVLGLGGWVSLTIVGMMLKIVPFLVWYRVYSPQVGRGPVPTLAQLSWPVAEALAYALLTGGVVLLAAAAGLGHIAGIRAAGVILALGAGAFVAALGRVVHRLGTSPVGGDAPRTEAGAPAR